MRNGSTIKTLICGAVEMAAPQSLAVLFVGFSFVECIFH